MAAGTISDEKLWYNYGMGETCGACVNKELGKCDYLHLKTSVKVALDAYYKNGEKYGEDYSVSDLLATLEYLCDYSHDEMNAKS